MKQPVVSETPAAAALARFASTAAVPPGARRVARDAWLDTTGVTLAGSIEPAARAVQRVCTGEGGFAAARVLGTSSRAAPAGAALANGTAAHALDYDDMCFVSLAHPSAPLVAAGYAVGELVGASGRDLLDAYVVGFEIECAIGAAVNPSHYQRGWHCTSTLGAIGAAAASARILQLDASATTDALAIAASEACGLKENFGTMVKPLHAGLAARNGVLAALLAAEGLTASAAALDGPQGFVAAMSDEPPDLTAAVARLGSRWETLETGITVKLYPSCAATHPSLDALLDLRRQHGFTASEVRAIDVQVDPVAPTVLIYPAPRTGLEGKFSMPYCLASAVVHGAVDIGTFDDERLGDPAVRGLASRVTMQADDEIGRGAPALTQALVTVYLQDGRVLHTRANGARGYPERPASAGELDAKFRACARRVLEAEALERALDDLHRFEELNDVRTLTSRLAFGGRAC